MTPWMALLNAVSGSILIPSRLRLLLLRMGGLRVPLRGRIAHGTIFRTHRFTMGRGSSLNFRCIVDNRAPVVLGSFVGVGVGVNFITSGHDTSDPGVRAGRGRVEPIFVGDGCYIGTNATILGGVKIAPGCVIAAGAVVKDDCAPHSLYGGVPARLIRRLNELPAG